MKYRFRRPSGEKEHPSAMFLEKRALAARVLFVYRTAEDLKVVLSFFDQTLQACAITHAE